MLEVLQFVFSNFWIWLGTMVFISMVLKFVFRCWNRLLRHLNVRKAGWPPIHLDGDGDWIKEVADQLKNQPGDRKDGQRF